MFGDDNELNLLQLAGIHSNEVIETNKSPNKTPKLIVNSNSFTDLNSMNSNSNNSANNQLKSIYLDEQNRWQADDDTNSTRPNTATDRSIDNDVIEAEVEEDFSSLQIMREKELMSFITNSLNSYSDEIAEYVISELASSLRQHVS